MKRISKIASFGLLLILLAVAGCGGGDPNVADISGTVLVDGKPATKGSITFIPIDGKGSTHGGEIVEGKYTSKIAVGNSKVEIRVPKVVGKKKLYNTPDSPTQEILEDVLPEKYHGKSELKFEAKPGRNEKDWDLKSK